VLLRVRACAICASDLHMYEEGHSSGVYPSGPIILGHEFSGEVAALGEGVTGWEIGAPVACADGVKDSWLEIAQWAARKLTARFGDLVSVEYFDLFEPDHPSLPEGAQLPLVLINGRVVSNGGKISVPAIRRHIEEMGVAPVSRVNQITR
jgi:NADPH:quinone reductase-like Zn-dependent oxidoreductase